MKSHQITGLRDLLLVSFRRFTHFNEAEDLCQHALLKLIENPHWSHLNSKKLTRLLFVVGRNHFRNQLKKQRTSKQVAIDFNSIPEKLSSLDLDTQAECRRAIKWLPELQREVIIRVIFKGQTTEQVALAMDKPLGTVKTWKKRGLDRLRAFWKTDN